jgi:hypothetical protein
MRPQPWPRSGGEDDGKSFWQDVGEKAAEAQKQISKNLETIRGNIIGARKSASRTRPTRSSRIAHRRSRRRSDHGLADALAELDAQIKGQNALAAAYQVSDAAAIKAEAHQKAEEQAIRHKGEVGMFYEKELALAVAKRAADGAKVIADIRVRRRRSQSSTISSRGHHPAAHGQALEEQRKKRQLMAR